MKESVKEEALWFVSKTPINLEDIEGSSLCTDPCTQAKKEADIQKRGNNYR